MIVRQLLNLPSGVILEVVSGQEVHKLKGMKLMEMEYEKKMLSASTLSAKWCTLYPQKGTNGLKLTVQGLDLPLQATTKLRYNSFFDVLDKFRITLNSGCVIEGNFYVVKYCLIVDENRTHELRVSLCSSGKISYQEL
ncbi:hypothetical protein MIDIC_110115 [Alphaproteobacteria bacterium]